MKKVLKVVVTGPPASGKSELLRMLKNEYEHENLFRFSDEVASWLVRDHDLMPFVEKDSLHRNWQIACHNITDQVENALMFQSQNERVKPIAVFFNRSTPDNCAWLANGKEQYQNWFGHSVEDDLETIDVVFFSEICPEGLFNAIKGNNSGRQEQTYKEACFIGDRLREVYAAHSRIHYLSTQNDIFEKYVFFKTLLKNLEIILR